MAQVSVGLGAKSEAGRQAGRPVCTYSGPVYPLRLCTPAGVRGKGDGMLKNSAISSGFRSSPPSAGVNGTKGAPLPVVLCPTPAPAAPPLLLLLLAAALEAVAEEEEDDAEAAAAPPRL